MLRCLFHIDIIALRIYSHYYRLDRGQSRYVTSPVLRWGAHVTVE